MRRNEQKPRVTLYPTSLSQSSHTEIDKNYSYKTPEKFSSKLGNALMIVTKICQSQKN